MNTVEITDENFREIYQKNEIVVLDFWAGWCMPCLSFAPIYEEVAKKFPNVVFGKIETEQQPKLSTYFSIRSIPTIMIIREELELFRDSGSPSEKELSNLVEEALNADMDEVRKKIETMDTSTDNT